MTAYEIIRKKRDGRELAEAEIRWLVRSFVEGGVADYQMSAFLMAVFFAGMTDAETETLTLGMLESGEALDLRSVPGPRVDKHSTGGVGDKLSLVAGPVAAAAGVRVPMVSGRGLGHTGGTLDKLEAIPGFRTDLAPEEVRRVVSDVGIAITGQSPRMAPADLRMYALRDVTATVDCVPLIVASILSKKLAAGLEGLVLDVKVGRGAFMGELPGARSLARSLAAAAARLGLRTTAVLTDMDAPLGLTVGNALEVAEAVEVLRGGGPPDVREVGVELGARMILLAGLASDHDEAARTASSVLDRGAALDVFARLIRAQGGDGRFLEGRAALPTAPVRLDVPAAASGYVAGIDALMIGLASVELGAGRRVAGERVDHAVGITIAAPVGAGVAAGDPVAFLHAADRDRTPDVLAKVAAAFRFSEAPPPQRRRVLEVLDPGA